MSDSPSAEEISKTEKVESPLRRRRRLRMQEEAAAYQAGPPPSADVALEKGSTPAADTEAAVQQLLRDRDSLTALITKLEKRLDAAEDEVRSHKAEKAELRAALARAEHETQSALSARKVLFTGDEDSSVPVSRGADCKVSPLSKVYEIVQAYSFDDCDPTRIQEKHLIFDIVSLHAWIKDKRASTLTDLHAEEAAGSPATLDRAIQKLEASFKSMLKPGPVPEMTVMLLIMYSVDQCGHHNIVDHYNNAVCAGIMAGNAVAAQQLLSTCEAEGSISYDLVHPQAIHNTPGMQILERELASGDATYLKAIYDLANAYITYRRNEDATQTTALETIENASPDLTAHDLILLFEKQYRIIEAAAELGPGEAYWTKTDKLSHLLLSRTEEVQTEFYADFKRRDVNWKKQSWNTLKAQLEKIEHRCTLPDWKPEDTPRKSKKKKKDEEITAEAEWKECIMHGKNPTHDTDGCRQLRPYDMKVIQAMLLANVCLKHAISACFDPKCKHEHLDPQQLAEYGFVKQRNLPRMPEGVTPDQLRRTALRTAVPAVGESPHKDTSPAPTAPGFPKEEDQSAFVPEEPPRQQGLPPPSSRMGMAAIVSTMIAGGEEDIFDKTVMSDLD